MSSESFSIERVVTLLGPFFSAAVAFIVAFAAKAGLHLNKTAVGLVLIAVFFGAILLILKWLHGRQLPAIAGLHITDTQLNEVHDEIDAYLAAHSAQLKSAEAEIGQAVDAYLDQKAPGLKVDIDALVQEVLAKVPQPKAPDTEEITRNVLARINPALAPPAIAAGAPAGAAPHA